MLLIIDANVASEFKARTEEAKAISQWLLSAKGRLAIGGKNLSELLIVERFGEFLLELRRAGRSLVVPVQDIEAEEAKLPLNKVTSNDAHVLALALAAGARLLYTKDEPLIKDFKNKYLIDNPRGRC